MLQLSLLSIVGKVFARVVLARLQILAEYWQSVYTQNLSVALDQEDPLLI